MSEAFGILLWMLSVLEIWSGFYTDSTFLLEPAALQVWLWAAGVDGAGWALVCHSAGNTTDQRLEQAPFRH